MPFYSLPSRHHILFGTTHFLYSKETVRTQDRGIFQGYRTGRNVAFESLIELDAHVFRADMQAACKKTDNPTDVHGVDLTVRYSEYLQLGHALSRDGEVTAYTYYLIYWTVQTRIRVSVIAYKIKDAVQLLYMQMTAHCGFTIL